MKVDNAVKKIQRLPFRLKRKIKSWIYSPSLEVCSHSFKLVRLGSESGGWAVIDLPMLRHTTILSCGLGEDASFDIEFAQKYQATVVMVDPTPRAIAHFEEIKSRWGQAATEPYIHDGKQKVQSYDLREVSPQTLQLYKKALWNESKKIRFYPPPNKNHVSHSILNFQNNYKTDSEFIEVEATTVDQVMAELGIPQVSLMKLDIEAAEIEVLHDMLHKNILPPQLLIEYDEIMVPSAHSKQRVETCHQALLAKGYRLIHWEKPSNLLYTTLKGTDIDQPRNLAKGVTVE